MAPRDWLVKMLWRKMDEDTFVLVCNSVDDERVPPFVPTTIPEGVSRGHLNTVYRFTRCPYNTTQLTKITTMDLGTGSIPTSITGTNERMGGI